MGTLRWMVKHITKICGIRKFMKHWKEWKHNHCPQCSNQEDVPRIIQCTHGPTNKTCTVAMDSLSNRLSEQQKFPSKTQLFINQLTVWCNWQEVNFPEPGISFLATTYQEQSGIGWLNFL
jgi:hypothetical protein